MTTTRKISILIILLSTLCSCTWRSSAYSNSEIADAFKEQNKISQETNVQLKRIADALNKTNIDTSTNKTWRNYITK
jgi:hypothetical protein